MSMTLTARAPLGVAHQPEIVAAASGWYLSVVHHEEDNRRVPKHYRLDRRGCLDLLLAVKRAWWRVAFGRSARHGAPGLQVEGLYVSSPLVEVAHGFFGDHVRVLGVKLRSEKAVRAFRKGLLASMLQGRRLRADLARNARRLSWSGEVTTARPSVSASRGARPPQRCVIPEPASWRPIDIGRLAPAQSGKVLLLTDAARERTRTAGPRLLPGPGQDAADALPIPDREAPAHPHAA